jgi:hypothetical protein
MKKPSLRSYRIVAVFLLGCLIFNYPVLALFNVGAMAFGVPVLYVYIFATWGLTIALTAVVLESGN